MNKGIRYVAAAALLVFIGYGIYQAIEWTREPAPASQPVLTAQNGSLPENQAAGSTPQNTDETDDEDANSDAFWRTSRLIPDSDVDADTLTSTQKLEEAFPGFYIYYMPKIYVKNFPADFAEQGNPNLFVKVMLPLILHENNLIKKDRAFLIGLYQKTTDNTPWDEAETARFNTLVQTYGLTAQKIQTTQMEELLARVDIIPPSLAVAVAGVQTNWGKRSLNAPFGQREWVNGKYMDKTYDTLGEAVHAFMLELNTLPSFHALRVNRAARKNLRGSLGQKLVGEMAAYNPEQTDYTKTLSEAFKTRALPVLDEAALFE